MNELPVFESLSPNLKDVLKYIATAAAGGVIGNRVDAWFMSLFYHQRRRVLNWLEEWDPQKQDLETLLSNESLRITFSKLISDISNEMDPRKILLWPDIANSLIRCEEFKLDKKQHFLNLFNKLDGNALYYLASIKIRSKIDYSDVFNFENPQPEIGNIKHQFYLGQLQCATTGLVNIVYVPEQCLKLSAFGEEFLDFVSNESLSRLKLLCK